MLNRHLGDAQEMDFLTGLGGSLDRQRKSTKSGEVAKYLAKQTSYQGEADKKLAGGLLSCMFVVTGYILLQLCK
jgi:hypothetical protein